MNTEQFTRAVARPASLWHQPDVLHLAREYFAEAIEKFNPRPSANLGHPLIGLLGLGWLQTTFVDGCIRGRRRKPLNEPLGSDRISCGYRDTCGKEGDALCSGRQRSNNVDSFHGEKLAELLEADPALTAMAIFERAK